jgi:transcription elongation GreA/GreB family factor
MVAMRRKELQKLHKITLETLKVAKRRYRQNKEAADKMSETAKASWSSGGDREYAQNQKDLNYLNLSLLEKLELELRDNLENEISDVIACPCYLELKQNGEVLNLYLLENVTKLPGYQLISPTSALGEAVLGKKEGDKYKVDVNDKKINGEVVKVK